MLFCKENKYTVHVAFLFSSNGRKYSEKLLLKKTSLAPRQLKYLRWASGRPVLPASCHSHQSFLSPTCYHTGAANLRFQQLSTLLFFRLLTSSITTSHFFSSLRTREEKVDFETFKADTPQPSAPDISCWMYIYTFFTL